ncbi:MAG: prepilin-type N-terminal cleavage/methylation domain-containing protein [Phycisphaeraceae bacterium]|nr:prepilin-type N-terminal cleavage/methylation domain-containing protein [Phycisphaeraceae bacterium]
MIAAGRGLTRRCFTLIELLGVMVIIVILVAISVPAFSAMLSSSRATVADGGLRAAFLSARDAAIQSADGGDSAAVFLYEPGGAISIVICAKVGEMTSAVDGQTRAVFVPDPTFDVRQLPRPWVVHGLAQANTITAADDSEAYGWYARSRYGGSQVNWVFPETGFFSGKSLTDGGKRQTFFVRFRAGSGELAVGDDQEGLVYLPTLDARRTSAPYRDFRPDRVTDHRRLVRSMLAAYATQQIDDTKLEQLLGDESSDTVLARPVSAVALVDVRALAREVRKSVSGYRGLDQLTGCLYVGAVGQQTPAPVIDPEVVDAANDAMATTADVYVVERYTGAPQRVGRDES